MRHHVVTLAQSHFRNPVKLVEFAQANADKFGIEVTDGGAWISTWHCNDFIQAATAAGIERDPTLYRQQK